MNSKLVLQHGRNLKNKLCQTHKRFSSQGKVVNGIKIPLRIDRGPVDILKALSATVKPEPISLDYKYQYGGIIDTTTSNYRKRSFSLAYDSGRKAAKWIVATHPDLFQHREAEPYIQNFAPPRVFDENSEVTEEILIELIEEIRVETAIEVYESLKKKGIDVSKSTKQQLLELVCFYNCTEKPDDTLLETQYFENPKTQLMNNWKQDGFAMKLFSEMERSSESYSAVIMGMLKYNDITNGVSLYLEAEDEGFQFNVDVYNLLLENTSSISHQYDDQMEYILNKLKKMARENIKPNVHTLNSILKSISRMKWFKSREYALNVYTEFTRIGIKPSLASYYHLLKIYLDRSSTHYIFKEILNILETETLVIQHADDLKFFSRAMEISAYNFKDVSLSDRVDRILNSGNNRDFLSKHFEEASYYRSYLRNAFENGDLDSAIKIYDDVVRRFFTPEVGTYLIILEQLRMRSGIQYLPRIWDDIANRDVGYSDKIAHLVVLIIESAGSTLTEANDLKIAKEIWECNDQGNLKLSWDAELLSNFLKIFLRCKDKEMSYKTFDSAELLLSSFIVLDDESLFNFMNFCISLKDKHRAMRCIEYVAKTNDSNLKNLIKIMKSGFALEQEDLNVLKKYSEEAKHSKVD